MDSIQLPNGLPSLVATRFQAAKESGDLISFDSSATVLEVNGIPFQLRYCPTLKSKPKADITKSPSSTPFNPFLNPHPSLFITDIGPSHILVLNKYALTPNHSILATKSFAQQTDLLEPADLAATYALLSAYQSTGHKLFGFYNSGPHSGASQPHRHVQFLPVESMHLGLDSETTQAWELLTDRLGVVQAQIPFTYFSAPVSPDSSPEKLHKTYLALYEMACYVVDTYVAKDPEGRMESVRAGAGAARISYNLGFTNTAMVILPRRAEGESLLTGLEEPAPRETGVIALNGTVLGGTLLVKDELEWNALKTDGGKLKGLLERIGIPFLDFQGEILGWKGQNLAS